MQNQTRFMEAINDDQSDSHTSPPSYRSWPEPLFSNSRLSGPDTTGVLPHSPSSKHRPLSPDSIGALENSPSSKHRPLTPELSSPGLESVWGDEGGKEVVMHREVELLPPAPLTEMRPERKRLCGFEKASFLWMLSAIILLVIALAVGLGAGLGLKHHSSSSASKPSFSSEDYIGGALDPAYYSVKGAFNGSGFAFANQSFDATSQGNLVLYFQHYTGQIRYMQLNSDSWGGGDTETIVATNAKNGTPISAVVITVAETTTWNIFFIDTNNYLRQRSKSNVTNLWADGPLSNLNLTAFDGDQVGMQACWYGNIYGDSDYVQSTQAGNSASNATYSAHSNVGMHLLYASNETTIQQYGWRAGDTTWTQQQTWTGKNGHAGIGCYTWQPSSTVTYAMLVNAENTAEIWWKDTNATTPSSASHPVNVWTNSSAAIPNLHPSTSLGYTSLFFAQDNATKNIVGYNVSWAAEATTISQDTTIAPGVPGTHLTVTALPDEGEGHSLDVFYQTEGDDITQYRRALNGGVWTSLSLTIADA